MILMVTEPILFGIYFFVLRKATLLNNGSAKVLLVQSFFGLVCLTALTIVFEGKQPWLVLINLYHYICMVRDIRLDRIQDSNIWCINQTNILIA